MTRASAALLAVLVEVERHAMPSGTAMSVAPAVMTSVPTMAREHARRRSAGRGSAGLA